MDTKVLEDIGLTEREIDVYIALLELGPSGAGKILDKANVHNSVFHFCVHRLIEKGLVSYIKKGNTKVYKAAQPNQFLQYLKDKEKEVSELLPELEARQLEYSAQEHVEMYEGMKGIITAMNTLLDDAKKGDDYMFFALDVNEKNKEIQEFYTRFYTKRIAKGVLTRGISPLKLKPWLEKRKKQKIKYTSMPTPSNIGLCNDIMVLVSWGEKPRAVLIHSKEVVGRQKEFFNALWKKL